MVRGLTKIFHSDVDIPVDKDPEQTYHLARSPCPIHSNQSPTQLISIHLVFGTLTEAISDNSLGQGVVTSASENSDGKPVIAAEDRSKEKTAQLRHLVSSCIPYLSLKERSVRFLRRTGRVTYKVCIRSPSSRASSGGPSR